jgi:hypothetical protein
MENTVSPVAVFSPYSNWSYSYFFEDFFVGFGDQVLLAVF